MPLYQILTVKGTLDDGQRERVADGIIRAHIEETDAPGELVHCVFEELPAGRVFTNFERSHVSAIRVSIRAGRSLQARQRLMQRISDLYVQATGVPAQTVTVSIDDVPAAWAMEGGFVLPDPHDPDEEATLARIRGSFATPPVR